jgi:hypothetical protein
MNTKLISVFLLVLMLASLIPPASSDTLAANAEKASDAVKSKIITSNIFAPSKVSEDANYTTYKAPMNDLKVKLGKADQPNEYQRDDGTPLLQEEYLFKVSQTADGVDSDIGEGNGSKSEDKTLKKYLKFTKDARSTFGEITYDVLGGGVKSTVKLVAPSDGYYSIMWRVTFTGAYTMNEDNVTFTESGLVADWSDVTTSLGKIYKVAVEEGKDSNVLVVVFDLGFKKQDTSVELDPYLVVNSTTQNGELVQDSNGVLYTTYLAAVNTFTQVFVVNSTDSGATWGTGKKISTVAGTSSVSSSSIAIDSHDNLHIIYSLRVESTVCNRLYYVNKTISGWSTPKIATSDAIFNNYNQLTLTLCIDSNDVLHYAWQGNTATYTTKIFYKNCTNGYFSAPLMISNEVGMGVKQQTAPKIAASNNIIFLTWKYDYNGGELPLKIKNGAYWTYVIAASGGDYLDPLSLTTSENYAFISYKRHYTLEVKSRMYFIGNATLSSVAAIPMTDLTVVSSLATRVDSSGLLHCIIRGKSTTYSANYVLFNCTKSLTGVWSTPAQSCIANITGSDLGSTQIRGTCNPSTNRITSTFDFTYLVGVGNDLYFSSFTLLSNTAPTIGNLEIPTNTYANEWFTVNATISDANGVGDFYNATIALSNSVTLRWETGDSWAEDDPSGYITLDSASCVRTNVNSTADQLSFRVKLDWSYPRGSFDIEAAGTKVYDSVGASGSSSSIGASTFENQIIVSGASVNPSSASPSQSLAFAGTIFFRGTTTPPNTTGITAKVSLAGVLAGNTTSITSGAFTVSASAPAVVGGYNYTIWASVNGGNSFQNGTVSVTVTLGPINDALAVNADSTDNLYPGKTYSFDYDGHYDLGADHISTLTMNLTQGATVRASFRYDVSANTFSTLSGASQWELVPGSSSGTQNVNALNVTFAVRPRANVTQEYNLSAKCLLSNGTFVDSDTLLTGLDIITVYTISNFQAELAAPTIGGADHLYIYASIDGTDSFLDGDYVEVNGTRCYWDAPHAYFVGIITRTTTGVENYNTLTGQSIWGGAISLTSSLSIEVTVTWSNPSGGTGGYEGGGGLDQTGISFQPTNVQIAQGTTKVVQFPIVYQGSSVVFVRTVVFDNSWAVLETSLPFEFDEAQTYLEVNVTVPKDASLGDHSISVQASSEIGGSLSAQCQGMLYVTVVEKSPVIDDPTGGSPIPNVMGIVIGCGFVVALGYTFTRRR